MIFKNIQELIDLTPNCEFCGSPLVSRISSKNKPILYPKYNMGFTNTTFVTDIDATLDRISKSIIDENAGPKFEYTSIETDRSLNFCYQLDSKMYTIFSIDKITNRITGNSLDRIQKVFWDHQLSVLRSCTDEKCSKPHQGYICESESLLLERKHLAIHPFTFRLEVITLNLSEKSFALMSMYEGRKTFMLAVNKSDWMQTLPFMSLHRIKGKENIINKFKTIILFS